MTFTIKCLLNKSMFKDAGLSVIPELEINFIILNGTP